MVTCKTNVLITGAAGRIGKALRQGLDKSRFNLILTDIFPELDVTEEERYYPADITDTKSLAACFENIDAVVHLAGTPNSQDWATVLDLNVRGAQNVMDLAVQSGVKKIVYASSVHAIGLYGTDVCFTESMPTQADSLYGFSKVAGEELLRLKCVKEGVNGYALRIFNFQDKPEYRRDLLTWISARDICRLVESCLLDNTDGFHVLYGVSNNSRFNLSNPTAEKIGYSPLDSADDYLEAIEAIPPEEDPTSHFTLIGGRFADKNFR